jgi:putative two-component system response regulator
MVPTTVTDLADPVRLPTFKASASDRVLVVDDDAQLGRALRQMLLAAGYSVTGADSAAEARETLAGGNIGVLLSDVNMPGQSGLELIRFALAEHPETATLLMSGVDDPEVARVGLEYGAYGYLMKPFGRTELVISVMNAFRRRALETRSRATQTVLEQAVADRTRSLAHTVARLEYAAEELEISRAETIDRLARAAEFRDVGTGAHLVRMSGYCAILAERFGIDPARMKLASVLHDVGKIATPDSVLLKPGPLTESERAEMERHAQTGYELLRGSSSTVLTLGASIALTHHEKYDGSGYPAGLSRAEIPLEARIAAVADVFDALTSDRVYRPAWTLDDTLDELRTQRGKHFDPLVLDAFFASLDKITALRATAADTA